MRKQFKSMWWHWQNLNEKGHAGGKTIKGSALKHWRGWLHFSDRASLNVEWVLWCKRLGARLSLGEDESAISVSVNAILFSFYLTFEHWKLEKWLSNATKRKDEQYGNGRSIGFHWTEDTLFVSIWEDPMEWRAVDPLWMHFTICPADIVFGRRKYAHKPLDHEKRTLTMPEGGYPVEIELAEDSWKRPRWPWARKILRANIECAGGVPVPGKGENSWDQGQDAIYSLTCEAKSFQDALSKLHASVMNSRERHGGRNWKPEAVSR